ncbi:MAG TPA: asparagine synthase (glutamine-hydrolyzing) [Terriglobales bacterium]|nr:asparagine synthase (glutamine-hydrolyzing) [Terriglobales bacterium]
MCGIAGVIGRPGEHIDSTDVGRMCQTIVHRGPDDEGIYCHDQAGLGMRRLSIIDVSGGHQPIHNEDKTIWVVYNGEIYNFAELREGLEHRGHLFYTHSDTEVIVHLYEEMGADCVTKLRGMFAIALYDERRKALLLARDRLGKKPLHYAVSNGRLFFGSEIKTILAVAPELAEVDREAILQYFYFGYIPDPRTAFTGIKKLPPGHLLEYSAGQVNVRQYWDVPQYGTAKPQPEEECLDQLELLLADAVRMRLISEVPLGALLSGGVDSSLVVALMARASSRPVKTFSIGFAHQDFDEAPYARAVAERFGTEHHELIVEPNIQETLDTLSRSLEEPFGDSSMIPTYHVCKMARQYVTVALTGDGGDELFAGYDRYVVQLGRERFKRIPRWIADNFRQHIYGSLPPGTYGRRFLFSASLGLRDRYIDDVAHLPALDRERYLFSDDLLAWADHATPTSQFQNYYDQAPANDALSRLMYLDTKTYLTADVLAKVDRMSMANSLEVRCPILDHVFVEHAASLPSSWKLRGQKKYILKKLAERVGVPSTVLHRPKQGFAMPLSHWWRNELKDGMLHLLLEPRTLQRGYFKPKAVARLVDEHVRGRRDRSAQLWMLLILELWHRNFLEQRHNRPGQIPGAFSSRQCTAVQTTT